MTSMLLKMVASRRSCGVIINEHNATVAIIRNHISALGRHFDFISLADLPARLQQQRSKPFCLMTFDDGKRSQFTETAPELFRYGIPAVFFVVTSFVGGSKPLWFDRYKALQATAGTSLCGLSPEVVKELPERILMERIDRACAQYETDADMADDDIAPMTWGQVRTLHRQGFAIGAHGNTHAVMTREIADVARQNIRMSIERVGAELGIACESFAFPNGNYTSELCRHAVRCGARMVMTTEPVWADESSALWRLPRIQLFPKHTKAQIELKLALAATKFVLRNPDGTGRVYCAIRRSE